MISTAVLLWKDLSFQIFNKYKKEDEYLNKDFKFTLSSSKYP